MEVRNRRRERPANRAHFQHPATATPKSRSLRTRTAASRQRLENFGVDKACLPPPHHTASSLRRATEDKPPYSRNLRAGRQRNGFSFLTMGAFHRTMPPDTVPAAIPIHAIPQE